MPGCCSHDRRLLCHQRRLFRRHHHEVQLQDVHPRPPLFERLQPPFAPLKAYMTYFLKHVTSNTHCTSGPLHMRCLPTWQVRPHMYSTCQAPPSTNAKYNPMYRTCLRTCQVQANPMCLSPRTVGMDECVQTKLESAHEQGVVQGVSKHRRKAACLHAHSGGSATGGCNRPGFALERWRHLYLCAWERAGLSYTGS